jgi:hypothetical protein
MSRGSGKSWAIVGSNRHEAIPSSCHRIHLACLDARFEKSIAVTLECSRTSIARRIFGEIPGIIRAIRAHFSLSRPAFPANAGSMSCLVKLLRERQSPCLLADAIVLDALIEELAGNRGVRGLLIEGQWLHVVRGAMVHIFDVRTSDGVTFATTSMGQGAAAVVHGKHTSVVFSQYLGTAWLLATQVASEGRKAFPDLQKCHSKGFYLPSGKITNRVVGSELRQATRYVE